MRSIAKQRRRSRYMVIGMATVAVAVLGLLALLAWSVAVIYRHAVQPQAVVSSPQPMIVKPAQPVQPPAQNTVAPFVPDYTIPTASDGLAPVITRLPTKQKIVFLTIDDGAYKDPSVVTLLQQNHIKASLFLAQSFIASNPDFFKQLTAQGSVVEDHTLHHDTNMTKTQSYAQQKNEICGMADYEARQYGHRPTLFRPPGGAYSDTMRKAANDCGMKAVVTWIAKANGGAMQYQVGKGLRAGDIVLMHFRPEFKKDLQAFVDAETAAGLHAELLESTPGVM